MYSPPPGPSPSKSYCKPWVEQNNEGEITPNNGNATGTDVGAELIREYTVKKSLRRTVLSRLTGAIVPPILMNLTKSCHTVPVCKLDI